MLLNYIQYFHLKKTNKQEMLWEVKMDCVLMTTSAIEFILVYLNVRIAPSIQSVSRHEKWHLLSHPDFHTS